jgi:hypothetical protein
MRTPVAAILIYLISAASPWAQDSPKPTISKEPLTLEQIAIYRIVLSDYRKGNKGPLNLSNKTELLQRTEGSDDLQCIAGISLTPSGGLIIHQIDWSAELGLNLAMVDRDRQQKVIDQNDPQNLVKKAIDDHEKITNSELDHSIKHAFETGVFALSEIAFDSEHRLAVVAYSFVCGSLCGNGETLVLKKTGQRWKVLKRCGGWAS